MIDPTTALSGAQTALLAGILFRLGTMQGTIDGLRRRLKNAEGQLAALRERVA